MNASHITENHCCFNLFNASISTEVRKMLINIMKLFTDSLNLQS